MKSSSLPHSGKTNKQTKLRNEDERVWQSIAIMTEDTELGDKSNGELLHLHREQATGGDLNLMTALTPKDGSLLQKKGEGELLLVIPPKLTNQRSHFYILREKPRTTLIKPSEEEPRARHPGM